MDKFYPKIFWQLPNNIKQYGIIKLYRYINAEIMLHGSCSGETEGMCGNWNGNAADDLTGGSPNSLGVIHQVSRQLNH